MAEFDQELETIKLAVDTVQKRAVRAAQKWAKQVPKQMQSLFNAENYAGGDGSISPLGSYGPRWGARKAALGLDLRRGHASLGISRALGRPTLVANESDGFSVDVLRASRGVITQYPRGKRTPGVRRVGVIEYVLLYAKSKANGLGNLTDAQKADLDKTVLAVIKPLIENLRRSAARTGFRSLALDVEVNLGRIGVAVETRALT